VGFLPTSFLHPANSLAFYVAIPSMIFRAVSRTSFSTEMEPLLIVSAVLPVFLAFAAGLGLARLLRLQPSRAGTFMQSSLHGNLGYIGLAVVFYYLGEKGLTQASILAGFLILAQNSLSVGTYTHFLNSAGKQRNAWFFLKQMLLHPVILAVFCGGLISVSGLTMPNILDRTLRILTGLALPLALLVIGASLSFTQIKQELRLVFACSGVKLLFLPLMGLALSRLLGISVGDFLPGFILLASPSATIVYVMSAEMGGDVNLATASISVSTLLSAITYTVLLGSIST
jgi:predicted permease